MRSSVQIGGGASAKNQSYVKDRRLVRAFGTRRSGNHAILQWLTLNLAPERHIHFDQAKIGFNPEHAGSCEIDGERLFPRKGMSKIQAANYAKRIADADLVTVFYEEQDVGEWLAKSPNVSLGYDMYPSLNVLIYRDFLNWLASVRRHPEGLGGTERYDVNQLATLFGAAHHWKGTVKRAFGGFSELKFPIVPVFFDSWATDTSYRQSILDQLNLPHLHLDLPPTTGVYGGGSSFEGKGPRPKGRDVTQRWRNYIEDEDFIQLLGMMLRDVSLKTILETHFPQTYHNIEEHFPRALANI